MMGIRLNVSNVWKSYNGKLVLNDCSYTFEPGKICALMGPNGSGKSTFLRICSILEVPDRGKVLFLSGNTIIRKDIELRRKLTLVLPNVGLFNSSVFNNVAYGLKIRKLKKQVIKERVENILHTVGLIHKEKQNAHNLSSGEAQRLAIARAMVIDPEMLFLDEPTVSVDEENKEIIENIILNMSAKIKEATQNLVSIPNEKNGSKKTIIIATHDFSQAERIADKVLLMQNGKVTVKK